VPARGINRTSAGPAHCLGKASLDSGAAQALPRSNPDLKASRASPQQVIEGRLAFLCWETLMRMHLLLAGAFSVLAAPAAARDGSPYVAIEGGVMFPKSQEGDVFMDFDTSQSPPTVGIDSMPDGPAPDVFRLGTKTGYDIDLIGGYDFGLFRLEGELSQKRAGLDQLEVSDDFLAFLNSSLNRPDVDVAPEPVETLPALTADDFRLDGNVRVRSAMVNGLLDFGNEDGLSFYVGGGAGRASVKLGDVSDSAWAFQGIAGVRLAVSRNIDLGLKYRYFSTGRVDLADETGVEFLGNPQTVVPVGSSVPVVVTTNGVAFANFNERFQSHSLLATLTFNFGGRSQSAPPPLPASPPPREPLPPPPPPAMQTCPDGSVIRASDICRVVPPPPQVRPQGERG
jgi:opacity protein-like surface antigen